MSKSYTIELNDNVVSKLQAIVGGGNPFVPLDDFSEIVANKHISVDNLLTLISSKIADITDAWKLEISGIFRIESNYEFAVAGGNSTSISGGIEDAFNTYKNDIEGVTLPEYSSCYTNFYPSWNDGSNSFETSFKDYVVLFLAITWQNNTSEVYSLTLDEIASFLS